MAMTGVFGSCIPSRANMTDYAPGWHQMELHISNGLGSQTPVGSFRDDYGRTCTDKQGRETSNNQQPR